jgi:hypothetical protein
MWTSLTRLHVPAKRGRPLRCSFCGRDENDVTRLVAGASAYICDACITECVSILQRHGGFEMPPDKPN